MEAAAKQSHFQMTNVLSENVKSFVETTTRYVNCPVALHLPHCRLYFANYVMESWNLKHCKRQTIILIYLNCIVGEDCVCVACVTGRCIGCAHWTIYRFGYIVKEKKIPPGYLETYIFNFIFPLHQYIDVKLWNGLRFCVKMLFLVSPSKIKPDALEQIHNAIALQSLNCNIFLAFGHFYARFIMQKMSTFIYYVAA